MSSSVAAQSSSPRTGAAAGAAEKMSDIHDIKGLEPIPIGVDWQKVAIWSGAGLLVAGLLAFLILRRRKKRPYEPARPSLPPEQQALADLDALGKIDPSAGKIFYFRLSNVFRTYLDGRFGVPAPEMTTEELLPQLSRLPLGMTRELELKAFLHRSDPVKFAGRPADEARMREDLELVRRFVLESSAGAGEGEQDV